MSTYVISDIHAHNYEFEAFYQTLKKNDRVFVLGDVIDKGNNGIKILQMMIHDERFHFCLGNHEYMMLEYLDACKQNNFFNKQAAYFQWCELNHGLKTLEHFEALSENEQAEIIDYLNNSALAYNITVNKKHYYLTHSYPVINNSKKAIFFKEYGLSQTSSNFVWQRVDYRNPIKLENKTIIAGHTPSIHYGQQSILYDTEEIHNANYIDIDTGLAYNRKESKLAVLKLNDLSVSYFQKD